ncbi:hypothetical protein HS041_12230 [Planomonospora sp. ID67723]|uniref:hypothetical protein n=1 Tax=Planomonospora sp. ID67723 TaxID=2738134 RepID=UPI0018C3BA11|nr:hypothetical protein [Planomonospora sp. ID67723]MBG0828536.1 hypothetical protein [Planomonospora sp. ID67723]
MKVYLATYGSYSDYEVRRVFARREDAEAYELADDVEEFEVEAGPVETRFWHTLDWYPGDPDERQYEARPGRFHTIVNPREICSLPRDYDGHPRRIEHRWSPRPIGLGCLSVGGWDIERVRKVYGELRAEWLNCQALGMVWDPQRLEWTPGEMTP